MMARLREELGGRRHARIQMRKSAHLILAPNAPWIECMIIDISEAGICLEVGPLAVPDLFGIAFTSGGEVLRVCLLIWRQGGRIGARYVSARELREGFVTPSPADLRIEEMAD
jgi:hypothetical protein